jgi:hypothetical protein
MGHVKVKTFFCLNNIALLHEDVWKNGGIAPPFLTSTPDEGDFIISLPSRLHM